MCQVRNQGVSEIGKDTVGYCGLWRSERFNHSGTPALGRFGESYGRGQRLEKPSLELCGGVKSAQMYCNRQPWTENNIVSPTQLQRGLL